jgi:hypothetical protein
MLWLTLKPPVSHSFVEPRHYECNRKFVLLGDPGGGPVGSLTYPM